MVGHVCDLPVGETVYPVRVTSVVDTDIHVYTSVYYLSLHLYK